MATFHCYCALCSSSLGSYEEGSKDPRSLRRRRARVARRIYWRSKGNRDCETEDEDEEDKEERLRSMLVTDPEIAREENDDGDGRDSESERTSYDPELLGPASLDWLHILGGLGNCDAGSDPRYFIANLEYEDISWAYIFNRGDPNTPDDNTLVHCYYGPKEALLVFPFHWPCFQLLCRAISGSPDYKDLDRKALYDTMSQNKEYASLNLPYGDITGCDQDWQSVPGEEYSVVNPLSPSALDRQEVERFCNAPEDPIKSSLDLSNKVQRDPFKLLPQEISDMILDYIPGKSLMALLNASWTMYARTRYPEFWKRRLYREMRWIWELRQFLEWRKDSIIDYKGLYIYLDEVTTPKYGMRMWLALANRRRIWGACEVLAERYHRVRGGKLIF